MKKKEEKTQDELHYLQIFDMLEMVLSQSLVGGVDTRLVFLHTQHGEAVETRGSSLSFCLGKEMNPPSLFFIHYLK